MGYIYIYSIAVHIYHDKTDKLDHGEGTGSVVKHLTADLGIVSSIPCLPALLKLLKEDMYWFISEKMIPCFSAIHRAR